MNHKQFFSIIIRVVAVSALCVGSLVPNGFAQSTATISVDSATNVIPKEMFGLLMERLGRQWSGSGAIYVGTSSTTPNTNGMRNDVMDGFVECGVGAIQWPGGCAATSYNWNPPNPATDVGTDRFIQFCQITGTTPIICGPRDNAASNVAWVKHIDSQMTSRNMGKLQWFKVGNEVWGGCGSGINVTQYMPMFLRADSAFNLYRPDLKLEACNDMEGNWAWITTMVNSIGSRIDGVEYHDYIYRTSWNATTTPITQYWQIMYDACVGDFAGHIRSNVTPALRAADTSKRIKLIVDEWGDWLAEDNWMQQINIFDAISGAMQLHVMMNNADRISVACLAQGVSVIHSVININTSGVLVKTPMFYVFKMFKPHHTRGAKWAPISASNIQTFTKTTASSGSQALPILNVGATVDSLKRVNISLSNMDTAGTRQITITLNGSEAAYVLDSAQIIQGMSGINSTNAFGAAETVNIKDFTGVTLTNNGKTVTVTLPALCVAMVRVKPPTAVRRGSLQRTDPGAFSVRAGSKGAVLITTSSLTRKTPVTISLYGIDGTTLTGRVAKVLPAGNSTCALKTPGKGTFIVSIAGTDFNLSKKIVLMK